MPIFFLFVGIAILIAAIRGTQATLFALLKGDFIGQNSFSIWILAIVAVGLIGYIPGFKTISNGLLVLVVLVILLVNSKSGQGFFANLQKAV